MLPAVEAWLSAEFDLPTIREHPLLRFVPAAKIAALRFRGLLSPPGTGFAANDQKTAFAQGDTLALYDDATHTIYLPEDWKGSTPFELSLLVHEMVHHFQNVLGLKHECPQQREKLAYVAQDHWLGLFGQSLADDFGLDAFSGVCPQSLWDIRADHRRGGRVSNLSIAARTIVASIFRLFDLHRSFRYDPKIRRLAMPSMC